MRAPVLYLPHGGGPLPLLDDPEHSGLTSFLTQLADSFPRPKALVVISAHWENPVVAVNGAAAPSLLYDYYGFPPESYRITWPAPGAPALADRVVALLHAAGMAGEVERQRGNDHGVFVPLKLVYPEADIPCVQVSLLRGLDPDQHIRLGRVLAPLREEDVMIIGSGMSFHNLQALFAGPQPALRSASDRFDQWLIDTVCGEQSSVEARTRALSSWEQAPHARFCHPREEHLLPLHVCFGAAGGQLARLLFNEPLMGHKVSGFGWLD